MFGKVASSIQLGNVSPDENNASASENYENVIPAATFIRTPISDNTKKRKIAIVCENRERRRQGSWKKIGEQVKNGVSSLDPLKNIRKFKINIEIDYRGEKSLQLFKSIV